MEQQRFKDCINIEEVNLGNCIFCDDGKVSFKEEFSQDYEGDFDVETTLSCTTKGCALNEIDYTWYSDWSCDGWQNSKDYKRLIKKKWKEFRKDKNSQIEALLLCLSILIMKRQENG